MPCNRLGLASCTPYSLDHPHESKRLLFPCARIGAGLIGKHRESSGLDGARLLGCKGTIATFPDNVGMGRIAVAPRRDSYMQRACRASRARESRAPCNPSDSRTTNYKVKDKHGREGRKGKAKVSRMRWEAVGYCRRMKGKGIECERM